MALRYDTVTFLSDYGLTDEFVGVVHSVLRSLAPGVTVIDLTHQIEPYDVRAGGLALARSAPYLCPGVVVAVVDPGVGTDRRGIAVEVGDGASILVGPDNGLLAPAVAMCGGAGRVVALDLGEHHLDAPGPTFDGRDVFAPVAAALCNGVPLEEVGTPIDAMTLRPGLLPMTHEADGGVAAEVLWVDRYGNAQLNVDPDELEPFGDRVRLRFRDQERLARRVTTFAEVGPNDIGLVVDSYGLVAVVVDQQSAATQLGLGPGTQVHLGGWDDDAEPGAISTPVQLGTRRDAGADR